ncbi:MAG: endo-1,4-beta-xylanase [Fimbriimonadaceae bacterium]
MLGAIGIVLATFIPNDRPNVDAYTRSVGEEIRRPHTAPFPTGLDDLAVTGVPELADRERRADALRVRVRRRNPTPYAVQIRTPKNTLPIRKGDVIFASLRVRCPESGHESGEGMVASYLQLGVPPWNSQGAIQGSVGRSARTMVAAFASNNEFAVGEAEFTIHIGSQAQVLEIEGLAILNLGPNVPIAELPRNRVSYPGMAPNAPWRKEAASRIDRYRKADLTVTVRDARGRPVSGAEVRVRMKKHAYEFGSFVEHMLIEPGPNGDRYRAHFLANYNKATVPMYWADWGWPDNRANYLRYAEWMQEKGIPTKAHVLLYPGFDRFMPTRLTALKSDPPALRREIMAHIEEILNETRRFDFVSWDIVNETRDLRELPKILGNEFFAQVFQRAHEIDPRPVFYINEYAILENGGMTENNQDIYLATIRQLLSQGAPLEGIGIQGHFGETLTSPEQIWKILDRFAVFGLPIQTTEFDIVTRDEEAQAAYLRDYFTAFFAHPATTGITKWGFYEGTMWQPLGAMVRTDWTLKPAGEAYRDLIFRDWWTNADLRSDRNGRATVRGFKGEYEVEVLSAGRRAVRSVPLSGPTTVDIRLGSGRDVRESDPSGRLTGTGCLPRP